MKIILNVNFLVGQLAGIFIFIPAWVYGFVLAKGFWSTVFCVFPPWAWYLTVERLAAKFL